MSFPDYYIDPINGNDNFGGRTKPTAFKTFKPLSNIWKNGYLLSAPGKITTVHILGDLNDSEPLNFDVILDDQNDLIFEGFTPNDEPENILTKPIVVTEIVDKYRPDNIPLQFTITGAVDVGNRIWDKTSKTCMWIVKKLDQHNNKFRISEPTEIPITGFKPAYRTPPKKENLFCIQSLPKVKTGSMRVGSVRTPLSDNSFTRSRLVFQNLHIAGDISPELDMGTELYFYGCSIKGSIQLASGFARNFVNCFQYLGETIRIISGLTRFFSGAYISAARPNPPGSQGFLPTNCTIQFDYDVIFQDHSISIVAGNTLIIGTAGIFDSVPGGNGYTNSAGHGIMVSAGSVTCRNLASQEQYLWGSGQKGHGVGVSSGGRFYYVSNPPTITGLIGSGKDYSLGESTNTNTWSSLDAKGNAKNPDYDALILKTQ